MLKLRKLRKELQQAGCKMRQKGSHQIWSYPGQLGSVVLSGGDGDDAQEYQIRKTRKFLRGTVVYQ